MRVGFIGLGIMGMPMATNVFKKFDVIGYDVVSKEAPFKVVSSIEELVNNSDIIISMVPKNEHVISVYNEVEKYIRKDMICIDMSTINPDVNRQVAKRIEDKKAFMLDCPVVKSQPAAVAGTLGIYVGGSEEVYKKVKPILDCMGNNIIYMGGHGQGLVMKIIHNMLVASIQNGVNEVMTIAKKMNMNIDEVTKAISYGGGQNFYLDTKANNIKNNEYKTAFSVANMNKDVHFALDMADSLSLELPGLNNIVRVYEEAMKNGLEKEDFSATFKIVSKEN